MNSVPQSALRDVGLHEQIIAIGDGSHYPIDKLEAHISDVRHVAISIFVFNNGRLLLQQRAATKYHSAGLWANSVCSHPRWNETVAACADRRLQDELGWHTPLQEFGTIDYRAQVGELFENEHVHCFSGHLTDASRSNRFNPTEVAAVQWQTLPEIEQLIARQPESFTEWFKIYMTTHRHMIDALLQQT